MRVLTNDNTSITVKLSIEDYDKIQNLDKINENLNIKYTKFVESKTVNIFMPRYRNSELNLLFNDLPYDEWLNYKRLNFDINDVDGFKESNIFTLLETISTKISNAHLDLVKEREEILLIRQENNRIVEKFPKWIRNFLGINFTKNVYNGK